MNQQVDNSIIGERSYNKKKKELTNFKSRQRLHLAQKYAEY